MRTLVRLTNFLKPYWKWVLLAYICLLLSSAASIGIPELIKRAIDMGIAINPDTGRTMAMISPYPHVRLIDWGDAGGHLAWIESIDVPPAGSTERVCYLVLCNDLKKARHYACLKKYP